MSYSPCPEVQRLSKGLLLVPRISAPVNSKISFFVFLGNNDGDMCKVTCSVGYLPAKSTMVKCVLGTWKCGDIKCVPVDCEMPKIKRANVGKIALFDKLIITLCQETIKQFGYNKKAEETIT